MAWVNQQGYGENGSASSQSDDYMVMSIKKKNVMEVKIPGARVEVEMSGRKMWLWVDSGSPVTIFSMKDLKATLGKSNFRLQPSQEEYLDYNNNRMHILGNKPQEVNGKNKIEAEKKLKSNLYLCIGDEAQIIFKARKPTVSIRTERYIRVLDEMQNVFRRERNVTYERGLFFGRKQRERTKRSKNSMRS